MLLLRNRLEKLRDFVYEDVGIDDLSNRTVVRLDDAQGQHVLCQRREPLRLLARVEQPVPEGIENGGSSERDVEVRPQRRDWSAKLVRRIRSEPLETRYGELQPMEESVERVGETSDFGRVARLQPASDRIGFEALQLVGEGVDLFGGSRGDPPRQEADPAEHRERARPQDGEGAMQAVNG